MRALRKIENEEMFDHRQSNDSQEFQFDTIYDDTNFSQPLKHT